MINLFRQRYPYGSLISELVQIEHGKYIVKVSVQIEGKTLATGLAADSTVEQAEDHARIRALALLNLEQTTLQEEKQASATVTEVITNHHSKPEVPIVVPAKPPQETSVKASKKENTKKVSSPKPEPEIEPEPDNGALYSEYVDEPVSLPFEELPSIIDDEPISAKATIPFEVTNEEPVDFTDVIAKIDLEMKRLGWTKEQGRDYLIQSYGKKSRQLLSDDELLEFLHYLENQ